MSWIGDWLQKYVSAEKQMSEMVLRLKHAEVDDYDPESFEHQHNQQVLNSHGEPSPANPATTLVGDDSRFTEHSGEPIPTITQTLVMSGSASAGVIAMLQSNSTVEISIGNYSNIFPNFTLAMEPPPPAPTVFEVDYGEMTEPQPPPSPPEPEPPRRRFTFSNV